MVFKPAIFAGFVKPAGGSTLPNNPLVDIDVTQTASFAGTGATTLVNLGTGGEDYNYDIQGNPIYYGDPNGKKSYLLFDGNDFLKQATSATSIQDTFHMTGAEMTMMMAFRYRGAGDLWSDKDSNNTSRGVSWLLFAGGKPGWLMTNGSVGTLTSFGTASVTADNDYVIGSTLEDGVAADSFINQLKEQLNDNSISATTSGVASYVPNIGARGNDTVILTSGTRFMAFSMWDKRLTDAEVSAVMVEYATRHDRGYETAVAVSPVAGDYYIPFLGQSNAEGHFEAHAGVEKTGQGEFEAFMEFYGHVSAAQARNTALGGSKLVGDAGAGWWNVAGSAPGPRLTAAYSTISSDGKTPQAFVWGQGEADAANGVSAGAYKSAFKALIADFRDEYSNPTMPVFVQLIGPSKTSGLNDAYGVILRAQLETIDEDANVHAAATPIDQVPSDTVHFDTNGGYVPIANRLARFISDTLVSAGSVPFKTGPIPVSAVLASSQSVHMTFTHDGGDDFDSVDLNNIESFQVSKNGTLLTVTSAERISSTQIKIKLDAAAEVSGLEARYGTQADGLNWTQNASSKTYDHLLFDNNNMPAQPGFVTVSAP